MGLDMYLSAKKFFWNTENDQEAEKKLKKIFPEMNEKDFEVQYLIFEVGYWRKVNAIHHWFVENNQEGKDDCGEYSVSRDCLQLLKKTCLKVLKDKNLAKELLENKEGFFFGSKDYDEYYFADIQKTVDIIDKVLKLSDEWKFEYSSSW